MGQHDVANQDFEYGDRNIHWHRKKRARLGEKFSKCPAPSVWSTLVKRPKKQGQKRIKYIALAGTQQKKRAGHEKYSISTPKLGLGYDL